MAQESKPSSDQSSVWPRVREQISVGSVDGGTSLGAFHVFEDGVEQTDAKVAKDARPASILLMIDVSTSTKPSFAATIGAARKLIASANPEDEFEIVTFSWPSYIEQEFTSDRGKLSNALASIKLEGGSTALFDAIDASMKQMIHAHGSSKHVMVLFSDAVDSSSTSSSEKSVIRALKTVEAPSMYIVSPAPQAKRGIETSIRLSTVSGGATFAADQTNSLGAEGEKIAQVIDGLSSIEYTSTHNKRNGKSHKIQVHYESAPGASKIEMVYRQEYYAPSQ